MVLGATAEFLWTVSSLAESCLKDWKMGNFIIVL